MPLNGRFRNDSLSTKGLLFSAHQRIVLSTSPKLDQEWTKNARLGWVAQRHIANFRPSLDPSPPTGGSHPPGYASVATLQLMTEMNDKSLNLLLETVDFGRHITDEVQRLVGDQIPLGNHALLVCCRLEISGDMRVKALADASRVTSGRATQVIGELAEYGFVSTRSDPDDGRGTVVSLTDRGHSFVHAVSLALSKSLLEDSEPLDRFVQAIQSVRGPDPTFD